MILKNFAFLIKMALSKTDNFNFENSELDYTYSINYLIRTWK